VAEVTRFQGGISGVGQRQAKLRRDWSLARAKCDADGACRNPECGRWPVEAAHLIGRSKDGYRPLDWEGSWPEGRTLIVAPVRIIPLCPTCHRAYDSHQLDVLSWCTEDEQAQAVKDAGGIFPALYRLMASENPRRVVA